MEGYNGRLDSLQAGFLSVKLQRLAEWNRQRQEAASRYNEMLSSVDGLVAPYQPSWSRPVHHLYVVRVADRDGLQKHLAEAKIDTGIHYPIPLHMQKAYETFGFKKGDFPVTEKIAREILSLPMYPQLQAAAQTRVVQKIQEFAAVGVLR
jgi:dTDP-4-amino-4,6-dideoxygalactose transaminase